MVFMIVLGIAFMGTFALMPVLAYNGAIQLYLAGILILFTLKWFIRNKWAGKIPPRGMGIFITGCDTGFGHMTALRLHEHGYTVFAGCLRPDGEGADKLRTTCTDRLHIVPLDVTDSESVSSAGRYVREHIDSTGGLWGVVNNAGIFALGDVELCTMETYSAVAEVNLFGMIRVTKEFLPLIRASMGRVVVVSSIQARFPWPSSSPYSASKIAVESIADSLRMEMVKFGVEVSIVQPAMFGGTTNIHGDENLKRHFSTINQTWAVSSDEVKSTYSRQYMQDQVATVALYRERLDAKTPDPVLNAIQDALTSTLPKTRYVVHGGPTIIDPVAVYGLLYDYLPQFVTDWVACRLTGNLDTDLLSMTSQIDKEKRQNEAQSNGKKQD